MIRINLFINEVELPRLHELLQETQPRLRAKVLRTELIRLETIASAWPVQAVGTDGLLPGDAAQPSTLPPAGASAQPPASAQAAGEVIDEDRGGLSEEQMSELVGGILKHYS